MKLQKIKINIKEDAIPPIDINISYLCETFLQKLMKDEIIIDMLKNINPKEYNKYLDIDISIKQVD